MVASARSRILVVDDDRGTCAVVAHLLSTRGYEVDVANSGPGALELVGRQRYDMALIDFRMPGMNGVELYARMREMQPDVVGVFLTGYPTIDTVYPAIDAGVQRVLAKPAASEEILAVVEEFVGKP